MLNDKEESLYDLINDPEQEIDIKHQMPKEFELLKISYDDWFNEVSQGWQVETTIPCGYPEFPKTYLSAVESDFSGEIQFKGRGFTGDWLINWVNAKDSITWNIDLVSTGFYKFTIEYACPQVDLGSEIILSVGNNSLAKTIEVPFDEPLYKTHDRAPRAGELEKPWGKIELGTLELKKGQNQVVIKAALMKGKQVMEVKSVILEKSVH